MDIKYSCICALVYFYYQFQMCFTDTITYLNTEHPFVYWFDNKTFKNFSMISRRTSRQDPRHYVEIYLHTLTTIGNDFKLDFYFYQLLTNGYRPSFIEMHFKFCEMVQGDTFFGIAMKKAFKNIRCPYPPGEYDLKNMTISHVPKGFPFNKGRIYCNLSREHRGVIIPVGSGYINLEVKTVRINVKDKKTRLINKV